MPDIKRIPDQNPIKNKFTRTNLKPPSLTTRMSPSISFIYFTFVDKIKCKSKLLKMNEWLEKVFKSKVVVKNVKGLPSYYERNKEKLKMKDKLYYQNNKEKILERHKKYYEENKQRIQESYKEYRKNYTQENIERIRKNAKERYYTKGKQSIDKEKVKAYRKEYYKNNKDKFKNYKKDFNKVLKQLRGLPDRF